MTKLAACLNFYMSGLNAGEKLEGWATAKTCDQTLPDYITN
jgi:hypothetical protein